MRRLIWIAALGGVSMSPVHAAPAPLTPTAQHDVVCFLLFAAATNDANVANEDKKRQAFSMALTYYFGKLAVEAPGLNLADAIREQAAGLEKNPKAKEIGASCDTEFSRAGLELRNLGEELQQVPPGATPSK